MYICVCIYILASNFCSTARLKNPRLFIRRTAFRAQLSPKFKQFYERDEARKSTCETIKTIIHFFLNITTLTNFYQVRRLRTFICFFFIYIKNNHILRDSSILQIGIHMHILVVSFRQKRPRFAVETSISLARNSLSNVCGAGKLKKKNRFISARTHPVSLICAHHYLHTYIHQPSDFLGCDLSRRGSCLPNFKSGSTKHDRPMEAESGEVWPNTRSRLAPTKAGASRKSEREPRATCCTRATQNSFSFGEPHTRSDACTCSRSRIYLSPTK